MRFKIDEDIRILVVDDYPDLRRMMIRMLHRSGFGRVLEAGDGQTCMRKAGRNREARIIACTAYA